MVVKKLIESELNSLTEEQLNKVYIAIKQLYNPQKHTKKQDLMSQLKQIKIDRVGQSI